MIFEAQVEYGTPDVERQAIRNCVEQAVFAEEVGFDGVWAVEHHSLIEYSHMSAPEIFLTAVAAKTSRIRVGHAAVCMPFGYNHPARVAERAAMLDIISDGRLNLGAARGRHRAGDVAVRRRPRAHHTAGRGGTALHRPLLARGHHPVGLRPADDPAPTRPPTPHGRAATGAAPPPAAVPRVHQPRDRAARRASTASARWCSASAVPR